MREIYIAINEDGEILYCADNTNTLLNRLKDTFECEYKLTDHFVGFGNFAVLFDNEFIAIEKHFLLGE